MVFWIILPHSDFSPTRVIAITFLNHVPSPLRLRQMFSAGIWFLGSIGLGPFVWVLLWCDWQISERLVEMCQNRWGLHLWPIIQQFTIQQVQKKRLKSCICSKSHHVYVNIYIYRYMCVCINVNIQTHCHQHVAECPHDQINHFSTN